MEMSMLQYMYMNCSFMDMNHDMDIVWICIGYDLKYAFICYVIGMVCIWICRCYTLSLRLIPRNLFFSGR